jgi:hypothetical protein
MMLPCQKIQCSTLALARMSGALQYDASATIHSHGSVHSYHEVLGLVFQCARKIVKTCVNKTLRSNLVRASYLQFPSCTSYVNGRPDSGPWCAGTSPTTRAAVAAAMCASQSRRDGLLRLTCTEPQAAAPPGHHHPQPHADTGAFEVARKNNRR